MPRQDVPYGGAICRLKERIAEIWDKLDEKLHSINGVEGDGAGNVEIVSGDAAITVSESPAGHYIEIGLDHGNLPSAAVSSVNGQTGAVRLDAADIPSDGDSNVQADIAANKTAINDCFDSVTSEQTARQNADAELQTNINAARASIPEMSTTPDPYKGVERDAQGRAFAADPAAGATDKTLVTANWVSQTGAGSPNNLVHKNGSETLDGTYTYKGQIISSRGHNQQNITTIATAIPSVSSAETSWHYPIIFRADDLSELGHMTFGRTSAGKSYLTLTLIDSNGISKTITLGVND